MTAIAGCGSDRPSNPSGGGATGGTDVVERQVERVAVTPESLSIVEHGTAVLEAVAYDADDEALSDVVVEWTSTNSQIATVDADGRVKGLQPGTLTIVATVGGKSGSAELVVTEATIDSVSPDSDSITLAVDATASISLKLFDEEGNELLGRAIPWVSADPSIATVDGAGTVTGMAPGTTNLSAVLGDHTVNVDTTVVLRFTQVAVGGQHTCALTAQGGAWCWGSNRSGQLGTDAGDELIQEIPAQVGPDPGLRFQMLQAGRNFTCGSPSAATPGVGETTRPTNSDVTTSISSSR